MKLIFESLKWSGEPQGWEKITKTISNYAVTAQRNENGETIVKTANFGHTGSQIQTGWSFRRAELGFAAGQVEHGSVLR